MKIAAAPRQWIIIRERAVERIDADFDRQRIPSFTAAQSSLVIDWTLPSLSDRRWYSTLKEHRTMSIICPVTNQGYVRLREAILSYRVKRKNTETDRRTDTMQRDAPYRRAAIYCSNAWKRREILSLIILAQNVNYNIKKQNNMLVNLFIYEFRVVKNDNKIHSLKGTQYT